MNSPDLIPRLPRRKRQPSAELMREQLALAADEIMRQREEYQALWFKFMAREIATVPIEVYRTPWWRRLFRKG